MSEMYLLNQLKGNIHPLSFVSCFNLNFVTSTTTETMHVIKINDFIYFGFPETSRTSR